MGCWRSRAGARLRARRRGARPGILLYLAVLLAAVSAGGALAAAALSDLLPGPPAGWEQKEPGPRTYGPSDLFEYIDGNADLFLGYGFQELAVGDYVRPVKAAGAQAEWISVDIYDMGSPVHAFGIYRCERPPDAKRFPAGAEGYEGNGLVAFWGGRYYVKVALVEGESAEAAQTLAAAAAKRLAPGPGMPRELRRLPRANRIADSERYVGMGALGHGFLREAVSADYKLGRITASLHVADLGRQAEAAQAWRKLRDFERRAGTKLARVRGVGEECFAGRSSSLGEFVAARRGRFVVIATSEGAPRNALARLARGAAAALE